jgi:hypothetical protein
VQRAGSKMYIRLLRWRRTTVNVMVKIVSGEGWTVRCQLLEKEGSYLPGPSSRSSLGSIWSTLPSLPVVASFGVKRWERDYSLSFIVDIKNAWRYFSITYSYVNSVIQSITLYLGTLSLLQSIYSFIHLENYLKNTFLISDKFLILYLNCVRFSFRFRPL